MPISHEQKLMYAGLYVLKKLDLKPAEGGLQLRVPDAHGPLEEVLDKLVMDGHLEIDRKSQTYKISKRGFEYIGAMIDEAETYIDEFDEEETADVVEELRARNLDPLRVRFLWGWYQGEFDDLTLFQQRRGFAEVETDWVLFVVSDDFYENLALDLGEDVAEVDA